jgi:hypothetical protein
LLFRLVDLSANAPVGLPAASLSKDDAETDGKALARDSRVVTSFFDGLLRFRPLLGADFWILERRRECFMTRLSFFVVLNAELAVVEG